MARNFVKATEPPGTSGSPGAADSAADAGSATASPDFEQALGELEALVERLERGDLPLEEALRHFERGIALTRHCQSSLRAAQQRVELLLRRESGEPEAAAFPTEEALAPEDDAEP